MKRLAPAIASLLLLAGPATARPDPSAWDGYLDYAYVYASAEPAALQARLRQYGAEAGMRLEDYVARRLAVSPDAEQDEARVRRLAIAQLLLHLAGNDPDRLDASVEAIRSLDARLARHENRYWYHLILAHRALERGQRFDFVGELLELWLRVVVPMETTYETLRTLSLSDSPNSGFVSALPYLYEQIARLIVIRTQQVGLDRDLDPLGALVRLLQDGRVGAYPDVIPPELSSRDYLDRIVTRLDGPESDAGSLTFTLALYEAGKHHDEARAKLANEGLGPETVKAIRVTTGAYEAALDRAQTLQGQAAVYTRVLRQLGEVYAAKQRLGVDPEIETPFTIEGAMEVYRELRRAGPKGEEDWDALGYRDRDRYVSAMHRLWEEIQEASLNAADYYLARSLTERDAADDHCRSAARIYASYLAHFHRYATAAEREIVPESAYFAAYEAARGYGDALIAYAPGQLSPAEMDLATRRYLDALRLFPFDRSLWRALTAALERQGRESQYLDLARPIAESVTRSRHVDAWIEAHEPGAERIATLRRAFADSQVLVFLGFAEESGVDELRASIGELRAKHEEARRRVATLERRLDSLGGSAAAAARPVGARSSAPAAPAPDVSVTALRIAEVSRELADARVLLGRLEKQADARTRALPLYEATLRADGLADEMRARRDHPAHRLLMRLYHEQSR